MIVASLLLCLACQESMDALLDSFASEDPARRTRAADRILARWREWPDGELEKLSRAESNPDADIAGRAKELARRIALRTRLGPALLEKYPDADRHLCLADEDARLNFLLEASRVGKVKSWPDDVARPLALNGGLFPEAAASGRLLRDLKAGSHYGLAPLLIQLVQEGPPERRIEAIQILNSMGTKEDCLGLLPCLTDGNAIIRANAVSGVGGRLRSAAVPHLKPLFQDASVDVRRSLVSAVGEGRIAELAVDLVPFLTDEDGECRWRAVISLGRMRSKSHAAAVARFLEDPNPMIRYSSAEALGEMGSKEHAAALARLLKDPAPGVRQMAVRGLGILEAREFADAAAELLSDSEPGVQSEVADLLGRWRLRSRAKDLLPLLQSDKTRSSAILALELLDVKETAEPLMAIAEDREERLREGSHMFDRGRAVAVVGALGAVVMAPRIAALITDEDDDLRRAVLESLVRLGDADRCELLINRFSDAPSTVAPGLAMFAPRTLVPHIVFFLSGERWVSDAALTALGGIGGEEARAAILPLLTDPKDYSEEAVWSLSRIGRPEDVKTLLPFLAEDRSGTVALAIGELAARGCPDDQEVIERLSTSTSPGAPIALARLGRKTSKEQAALLEDLLRPQSHGYNMPRTEPLCYGVQGISLHRALEAIHEPEAFARFEKELLLENSLESLDDLRDLLRKSGLVLDVAPAVRRGRLPKGIRTTLRAVCDWMLDGNSEIESIEECGFGHERRVVLQGSTVKLLRLSHQGEYWRQRLVKSASR